VVDAVSEVLRIPESAFEPPPAMVSGVESELISAVGKLEDRLLIVLNLKRVVERAAEVASLIQ
jgi:purine-binding chemotaxis protein CheW